MNILILNYEFPPLGGGASPVSYSLARELVRKGHGVDVVTMHYEGLPAFEVRDGIKIHRVKCLRKYKELCRTHEMLTYVLSARLFLRTFLRDNPFDLCHCHFIIPTGIVARWVKKKFGIPYIITSHGSDVPGYNPDRFQLQHKFTKPLLRSICAEADGLTTPSQYLADLIRAEIGEQRIAVIPNGSRDFYKQGVPKEKIIVSSGRLLQRKGYHLLIRCFQELNPKGWTLYIVGDGPYRSELESLVDHPGIVFTGWLDNTSEEYTQLMNRASVFALLSSRESQGIVYIEAMSCACAILASDITACRETVSDDVGYRVPLTESGTIKARLSALIVDDDLREACMVKARERYLGLFRYEQIIDRYLALLNGAVPRRASKQEPSQ